MGVGMGVGVGVGVRMGVDVIYKLYWLSLVEVGINQTIITNKNHLKGEIS